MKQIACLIFSFAALFASAQNPHGSMLEVKDFGSNPGRLRMYSYVDPDLKNTAPLVMVLHGCTQSPEACADLTGWNRLASQYGFYVAYADQRVENNGLQCFNWMMKSNQLRDEDETASIAQMIQWMKKTYRVDSSRVYIFGLSAGAAEAVNVSACYPELISKIVSVAGGPFGAASNKLNAMEAMAGTVHHTPEEWADMVRKVNPGYTGKYPDMMIVHGKKDIVCDFENALELAKQWAGLFHADINSDQFETTGLKNNPVYCEKFLDTTGHVCMRLFLVEKMGHALPIDRENTPADENNMWAYNAGWDAIAEAMKFFELLNPVH